MLRLTKTNRNWDLYIDEKTKIVCSIANNSECKDSYFGNMRHVVACIYNYNSFKKEDFTPEGLNILMDQVKKLNSTIEYLFLNAGQKLVKNKYDYNYEDLKLL